MAKKEYKFDIIEREIADVFRRLSEVMPNASFVYSYAYATDKDPKKADVKGRVNMCGSKEEVEAHLAGLQETIIAETKNQNKRKDKVYGIKKT